MLSAQGRASPGDVGRQVNIFRRLDVDYHDWEVCTIDGFNAKLIVLMLGTNNINRNPNADIAQGDRAIIDEFRKRQPAAKVLVLGVFPRGLAADNPFRASIKEINTHLQALADTKTVFYMDVGDRFLAPDGTLPVDIMPDGLHPNTQGYKIWADAIVGRVRELMQ